MKFFFTPLFCAGAFFTSFAQSGYDHHNDGYTYNQDNHFDRDHAFRGDKCFQIERINHEFDFKVQSVENNWILRRHQKKVAIRQLERERSRQIRIADARFRHH